MNTIETLYQHKCCSNCNVYKEITEFHQDKYQADGHKGICKVCVSVKYTIPHYYENQRSRIRASKEWNAANKDKVKANREVYLAKNKEALALRRMLKSKKFNDLHEIME
jgi:hypothetical protein